MPEPSKTTDELIKKNDLLKQRIRELETSGAELKRVQENLRQSEERYRNIIETIEDGYIEVDLSGNWTFVNNVISRHMGYSREELIGMDFHKLHTERSAKISVKAFAEVYETEAPLKSLEVEGVKKDGTIGHFELSVSLMKDAQGQKIGFHCISRDVSERKRQEEKIQYLATHDILTGLTNRVLFNQLLGQAIQSAKRKKEQFALFFIDLDRFKTINDTLGHEAGDQLLKEIAVRFKQGLRAMDVVARLGGDEFVVMVENIKHPEQVTTVAHKILAAAMKPVLIMSKECRVTASIGISIYPKDGEDELTLMKNADIAMYFAKEEGKNNFQFYKTDITHLSNKRLSIESHLYSALAQNELSLAYQPKLDFKTGEITGVEALLRWKNPELGSVTPTHFIPVAEETGLIIPIGRWVLETACKQNAAWQNQGLPPVCMAVNLSLAQLINENIMNDIENALKSSGLAPNYLELEVTESMIMHNPVRMIPIFTRIKELGIHIAVDDFGTGYSSLAQIKNFPMDTLKVDRSFIRNIPRDKQNMAITKAILAMGKTLNLTVVAEGVETEEQMDFLREYSCDEMQGFYFSKPVTADSFAELLGKHLPSSATIGSKP